MCECKTDVLSWKNCYRTALDRVLTFSESCEVVDVRLSLGILMYWGNAVLFHVPSIMTVESSRLTRMAAVVSLILKPCPAN